MLEEFLSPKTWTVRQATFRYLDGEYTGEGELHWEPGVGFRIDLDHATRDPACGKPRSVLGERAINENDFTSIRMALDQRAWAVVPRVLLGNRLGSFRTGRLSLHTDRVVFKEEGFGQLLPGAWLAYGLYSFNEASRLPDMVSTKVTVGDRIVKDYDEIGALAWESGTTRVLARMLDSKMMRLSIESGREDRPRSQLVRWPTAFADAMCVLSGVSVPIVAAKRWRGRVQTTEVQLPHPPVSLGVLSVFNEYPVVTDYVVQFADFLSTTSVESRVCHQLLASLVSAAEQKAVGGLELAVSTTLEAVLRTLYGSPFVPGRGRTGVVRNGLRRFCKEHGLMNHSDVIAETIWLAQTHLRNRNAHPDWIRSNAANVLDQESYLAVKYLITFYRFMMASLAGVDELVNPFTLLPGAAGLNDVGWRAQKTHRRKQ